MDVRVLVTLDHNVPHVSRNKIRVYLFLDLMMIQKVNLMMKLLSILQPSLADVDPMKILVMRMFLMKNFLFHIESFM